MKKLTLGLIIAASIIFVSAVLYIGDSYIPFNPADWKNLRHTGRTSILLTIIGFEPRDRMLRRLERQYQLIGMSQIQLIQLLGQEGEPRGITNGEKAYYMSSLALYRSYVVFRLQKGKVVSYRMVTLG